MHLALVTALLLQAVVPDSVALHGARSPAYAPDGRLAISVDGDLLVQLSPGARWVRVTSGPVWDRDPAWTRDGSALVFSSDRAGNFDLWRVRVNGDGTGGEPERITHTPEPESAPTIAPDGSIAFVRGSGNAARIWIRAADGTEKRLNTTEQAELAPAYAPDGTRIAWVQVTETGRRLVSRSIGGGAQGGSTGARDVVANSDRNAERVAWAPGGDLIAFTAGSRGGIYIAPIDGRWTNLVSTKHGDVAWSADGKTIAIAEHEDVAAAYNGDPDRLGERVASESFSDTDRLFLIAAPAAPDAGLAESPLMTTRDRAARNADAYDRVWERSAKLYFSTADAAGRRAQWEAVKAKHRAEALAARSDDELQGVIYSMLRERPVLKAPASGRAAVSSAHPVATNAGLEILRAGGNVVDAAVAVSFALGVVEPDASGVGGYGQMVISLVSMERPILIDFMTRVPEDAPLTNTALLQNGRYPPDGPVLTNVPGTVAGMYAAFKKYGSGKIPWNNLLAPAIRAARDGYEVSEGLATTLSTEREHFIKYEGSRTLFFAGGKPRVAGDSIRNTDLAWVLDKIAQSGADGFYKGEVASKWVTDLRAKGNAMKLSDLARYYAPEREPVSGTYRGYTLYSSAPPVSGGAELAGRLNLLEQFDKPRLYTEDAATLHAAVSAWLLVPSSRNRIADPGLWAVDVAPIISKDTARLRWKCFDPAKALTPAIFHGDTLGCAGGGAKAEDDSHATEVEYRHAQGTTAFTIADNEGNAIAVTQTLGTWGGNFYVTPGLGFLSNDKLTSYGTDPAQYGSRLPFARHGSTLAPTIVMKGRKPVFAVGAAGNNWITSAVFQTILGALDYGLGPQQALELPRFIPGGGGGGRGGGATGAPAPPSKYSIQMEDGFSPEVTKWLRELGYDLSFISMRGELREGYGAAVSIDGKRVTAGADPRRAGSAGAVP
ncbi:MAG TPA: gamma-glutamyltransferase [Gemmatimonadaceae bacterium]|nr:gamma-glutamyltransferase [Gemmatimonadaceae bacterium]